MQRQANQEEETDLEQLRELEELTIKMAVYFEKKTQSTWMKCMTSWVMEVSGSQKVKKVEVEEEVDWDELPPEVKTAWLNNNQSWFYKIV